MEPRKPPHPSPPEQEPGAGLDKAELEFEPTLGEEGAAAAPPGPLGEGESWRRELSERVQNFQRRRARMRSDTLGQENLDLEFEGREESETPEPGGANVLEFPLGGEDGFAEIERSAEEAAGPPPSPAGAPEIGDREILAAGDEPLGEFTLSLDSAPRGPLEIVIEPPGQEALDEPATLEPPPLVVAGLASRFAAALLDGLSLALAGALFAVIFWRAGGRLSPIPANLAVVLVVALIVVFAYFSLFTALTSSTPGLALMGLQVRNMDGQPPTRQESLLRAFGYLVSLSSFLLGFFWAALDSDLLTWHDRISGTFLTPAPLRTPVTARY